MFSALLRSPTMATFLLTSLVLAITPGPAVLYLLTRTLSHGRRAGLASIGGVAAGNLGNATIASLGLAIVVAQSTAAFTVVKLGGAAYLMSLGIQALRTAPARSTGGTPGSVPPEIAVSERVVPAITAAGSGTPDIAASGNVARDIDSAASVAPVIAAAAPALPRSRLFRDGFLVALLNPKTALFFAALLPQFIDPGSAPLPQTLLLGGIFVAVAMCTDTMYVMAAAALAPLVRARSSGRAYARYLSAATFFGLGLYAALASPRSTPRPLH